MHMSIQPRNDGESGTPLATSWWNQVDLAIPRLDLPHVRSKSIASSPFKPHLKQRPKNTLPWGTTVHTPRVRRVPSYQPMLSIPPVISSLRAWLAAR